MYFITHQEINYIHLTTFLTIVAMGREYDVCEPASRSGLAKAPRLAVSQGGHGHLVKGAEAIRS